MDPIYLISPALLLLFVTWLLHIYYRFPSVPGPSLLQFLPNGSLYGLLKDPRTLSPLLTSLAKRYGPVYSLWLGYRRVLVTAVPADILQIVSSEAHFHRAESLLAAFDFVAPGGIFMMRPAVQDAARKSLRKDFNYSMLQTFQSKMNAAITELTDSMTQIAQATPSGQPSAVFDLTELLIITTFRVVTNVAFSRRMSNEERVKLVDTINKYIDEMMMDVVFYPIRQMLEPFGTRKLKNKVDAICTAFIKKRLEEPKEEKMARPRDVLDAIMEMDNGQSISLITCLVVEVALGGSHTINQIVAWSIYETCCNARVVAEIEKELSLRFDSRPLSEPLTLDDIKGFPYINKVWKETLRKHPAGASISRAASRDVTLKGSGVCVPKGTTILALNSFTQMDPALWKDPEEFRPERWGFGSTRGDADLLPGGSYTPFGTGPMSCAGNFLADFEGPLILAELHRRFKFRLACKPQEIVVRASFVDCARYASVKGGDFDMGVPVRIELRESL